MERLTDIDSYCALVGCDLSGCIIENCYDKKLYDKLKAYEDAEEQGLLLRLHFGIGDIVYEVSEDAEGNYYVVARKCRTNTLLCALNKRVGKTIFLTKEEAEQALARMEKDNG